MPLKLDLTCDCLKNTIDFDWITLDANANTLYVSTSNSSYIGDYQIVLAQSFKNFDGETPFTSFNISIRTNLVQKSYIQKPPYFAEKLLPQNVTQCPDQNSSLWSFTLPKMIDPNNLTITLNASYDTAFFTFDRFSNTVKQIKIA